MPKRVESSQTELNQADLSVEMRLFQKKEHKSQRMGGKRLEIERRKEEKIRLRGDGQLRRNRFIERGRLRHSEEREK